MILEIIITSGVISLILLKKQKIQDPNLFNQNKENKKYMENITVKEIAKYFETTQKNINKALKSLSYAEQNGKWWIVTKNGINAGGIQQYNAKTKQKYIIWKKDIIHNPYMRNKIQEIKQKEKDDIYNKKWKEKEKKQTIKKYSKEWTEEKNILKNPIEASNEPIKKKITYKEKIKKGEEYEEYVAKVYKQRGYKVYEYGKLMGIKDKGIDLIAKKEKKVILIQCKNWQENGKWKITHKEIKVFQTEARLFVENSPIFKQCKLEAKYVISGNFIHASAIKHIEEIKNNGKKVDYEIIKLTPNNFC